MKRTGPPRKPTALKVLHGTFRKDLAPVQNEPQPEIAIPDIPEHLGELAKQEWERVAHELAQLGLLSRLDRSTLAAYCDCWADYVEAARLCVTVDGKDRKVIKTAAGNLVENPYFSIKKRCLELMHKFAMEFGMSAASRTRINVLTEDGTGHAKAKDNSKNYA